MELNYLEAGSYLVYVELEHHINMNQCNFTLTCYGQTEANITNLKIMQAKKDFLQNIYQTMVLNNQFGKLEIK